MSPVLESTAELSPLKHALLELRSMRARLAAMQARDAAPVAIVGMGMRFPGGADTPGHFWELLATGREVTSRVPPDRWAGADQQDGPSGFGAFLADVDLFAPEFFGIAPREAELMDPQQRLLLEVAWEALEHAGQSPQRLFGTQTGIFLGISNSDYLRRLLEERSPAELDSYWTSGNALSVAAGRLSYVLGTHGPSVAIDTACSSSLVAVHQACSSLRNGETDLALAGGVNLILAPAVGLGFARAGMLAPDGHCKAFDARADGYVRGEGCGLIVLKRLTDAEANGDNVLAVIRSSAVNQDGRSGGLTAPNGPSQEAVIRAALAHAGVAPHEIDYLEAHGTGTPLGDPIELQALAAVLSPGRAPDAPLLVGALKANIGHLESAAGIAGLIKAVLCLQHHQVPPDINVGELNPYIDWHNAPVRLPRVLTTWPTPTDRPRRAGVSSFGLSGTNAHVVLEEAPRPSAPPSAGALDRPLHLLPLSARDQGELADLAGRYAAVLAQQPELSPADVCLTAATGRSHFEYRLAVVGSTLGNLQTALQAAATAEPQLDLPSAAQPPDVAFLFTGQGGLVPGSGRELYATEAVFRDALDRCDALLRPALGGSLIEALYPSGDAAGSLMHTDQAYAQTALFALQHALVELWAAWGISPGMVLGHSVGEVAAACAAGVLSLEAALELVAARGRLMQSLPDGGGMAAVQTDEATLRSLLADVGHSTLSIAAINAPDSLVLSGERRQLLAMLERLSRAGIEHRLLTIRLAAHSAAMDPILDAFESIAAGLRLRAPRVGLVAAGTGLPDQSDVATPGYWRRNLRAPVRFADGMRSLWNAGCRVFVEIGPHATLLGLGRRSLPGTDSTWLPSLHRERGPQSQMLESLATLYSLGADIDWVAREAGRGARRVPLPTYPWRRQRYWALAQLPPTRTPGLGTAVEQSDLDCSMVFESAVQAAREQADQGPLDLDLPSYPLRWERLSVLSAAYMARCLAALGVFTVADETHDLAAVMRTGRIDPVYARLVGRWLEHLTADGRLASGPGGTYRAIEPLSGALAEPAEDAAALVMADVPQLWAYLRRCGSALPDILTGRMDALGTLFPDGSSDTAEFLYHGWPVARYCNSIVRAATVSLAQRYLASGRSLRILEIGAGTGGTTRALLPALAELSRSATRLEYVVSDVSDFFLARLQVHAAALPGLRTRVLDIERPPADQGLELNSFDVVIAANVLHATVDLERTLRHTRSLLTQGGSLVLYETTRHPRWLDVTTGLIAGWQRFNDTWRSDHPLLAASEWQQALESVGFASVAALPEPGSAAEILGQSVLLARESTAAEPAPAPDLPAAARQEAHAVVSSSPSLEMGAEPLAERLAAALPDDRHELLVDFVRLQVGAVLRAGPAQKLGRDRRLMDLGLDSLMAIELRNRLEVGLGSGRKLPATLIFDHPSIAAVADFLDTEILTEVPRAEALAATPPGSPASASAADIAAMSDDDVERLLVERLQAL